MYKKVKIKTFLGKTFGSKKIYSYLCIRKQENTNNLKIKEYV